MKLKELHKYFSLRCVIAVSPAMSFTFPLSISWQRLDISVCHSAEMEKFSSKSKLSKRISTIQALTGDESLSACWVKVVISLLFSNCSLGKVRQSFITKNK